MVLTVSRLDCLKNSSNQPAHLAIAAKCFVSVEGFMVEGKRKEKSDRPGHLIIVSFDNPVDLVNQFHTFILPATDS